jgi:ATPase subunit of ABC transporter with duplicated ATPase domains
VLLGRPDVLLMDEPTNHLDIESIIWLEQFLKSFAGAILMTSHDREFMNRLVSKIAEIDAGEIIAYSGNYDFYDRERAIRETNRQAAFARQQSMLAKEQRFIDRFRTHAAKAAQVQSRIAEEAAGGEVRVSRSAALGRAGGGDRGRSQTFRPARDL